MKHHDDDLIKLHIIFSKYKNTQTKFSILETQGILLNF